MQTLSGTGYNVTGSVGFGSADLPMGTTQVTWNLVTGTRSLNLTSNASIDFQVRVIETAPPPSA